MSTPLDYQPPREQVQQRRTHDRGVESLKLGVGCPLGFAAAAGIAFAEGGPAGTCLFLLAGILVIVFSPFGVWLAYADRRERGGMRPITRWAFALNLAFSCMLLSYLIFIFANV